MNKSIKKILNFLLYALILFIGVVLGVVIKDFPYLTLKNEVGVSDLANLLLTIVVAILIPISLSPILTNKRIIKDYLIDETKDCIIFLSSIKKMIEELSLKEVTEKKEKIMINSMISRDLSIKLSSLTDQLKLSFERQSKDLISDIDEKYKEYWQELTSGELMSEDFKFDIKFCINHDKNFKKVEACLKKIIHKINNF